MMPFELHNCENLLAPVLVSVPHAGRLYSRDILDNLAVPSHHLMRLEDRYADRLASLVIAEGFPVIIATQPRALIDLNRAPSDVDPAMVEGLDKTSYPTLSAKVRGGLGLVPRRLNGAGELWRRRWPAASIEQRVTNVHEPYHTKISGTLASIHAKFGVAALIDLHSMPSLSSHPDNIDIVVGDRFGRSATSVITELTVGYFEQLDMTAKVNHPYAGGYVLDRHSNPAAGVHALQIEVDRSLYLDSQLREPSAGAVKMARVIADLCAMLSEYLSEKNQLIAAE